MYSLQWKRTQKQMTTITAVNKIQSFTLVDGADDHDVVSNDSNTATDDDDE